MGHDGVGKRVGGDDGVFQRGIIGDDGYGHAILWGHDKGDAPKIKGPCRTSQGHRQAHAAGGGAEVMHGV
ncbi:hypothetical protein GHA01_01320 [Novacetimonas hansenii]|uniref:Uncharacterized protein n=1 Tax=Novacetimonas hansenii TaxID=436 RepID=A0ABQ0SAS1_NOVHA|nr:hypothetical protein Gaha_0220_004 [Novacetimonas hansenii JCM 7643]GBQ56146.1 hypothetical protein AA0243_1110 [Novacetimonas hansenii NRIC 0243]GEC62283.1 hypothetical protein GHA01_01320 [Novacetimonas hansenii]